MKSQRTIKAVIRPGEQSGYVAECMEIPVVTQGATLDEVTHNLQEAEELCDRVAVLHKGQLAGCGTINELRGWSGHQAYSLAKVFERLTARSEVA